MREGKASATVLKERSLSHVIDTAVMEWGLPLTSNPVKFVRRPSSGRGRERRLTAAEEAALLEARRASDAPMLAPIFLLALETAMRLGELLSLDWHRIDLERQVAILADTKTGDSRQVPLSSRALAALRDLPRHITDSRAFWRWSRRDSFENAWRRAVANARDRYMDRCLREGLAPDTTFLCDLRFHDTRHEATSRLFERGFGLMEVASITGHKTLQMLKRYTHLRAEALVARLG